MFEMLTVLIIFFRSLFHRKNDILTFDKYIHCSYTYKALLKNVNKTGLIPFRYSNVSNFAISPGSGAPSFVRIEARKVAKAWVAVQ